MLRIHLNDPFVSDFLFTFAAFLHPVSATRSVYWSAFSVSTVGRLYYHRKTDTRLHLSANTKVIPNTILFCIPAVRFTAFSKASK